MNDFKMNWFEYWIGHCWLTGWQSINGAFRNWVDLMRGNYAGYNILEDEDPYECCLEWFWVSLGEDNTYPKDFLEELFKMSEEVKLGNVKTYTLEELMEDLKDLDDLIDTK